MGILDEARRQQGAAIRSVRRADAPPPSDSPRPRFRFIRSDDFAAGDYRPTWLVPRVLVKGQPGVIAGPSKGMKTSILIDLAVSIAAGKPFLDAFEVTTPTRVAVVSGESGEHTLKETAERVCRARGILLSSLVDRLHWCFDLPTLADVGIMAEFGDSLAGLGADVVIIDPLYLTLGGNIDHANMFQMGAALRVAAEVLLKAGVTPILVHHANRGLVTGEPMELQHLAYSGLEQFARQFFLINRREKYRSDGVHDLWFRVGGSAGHGGLWAVHVEEGTADENFAGRQWAVTIQTPGELAADRADRREEVRKEAARQKRREDGTTVLNAIDDETEAGRPAATRNRLREVTGFSASKLNDVVSGLVEEGFIVPCEFKLSGGNGASQMVKGFKRRPRTS